LTVVPKYRADLSAVLQASVLTKDPGVEHPIGARFGGGLVLEAASVEPKAVRRYGVVELTTLWRVDAPVHGPWQIFTELEAGDRIEPRMHGPVDGLHPVTSWKPGTWVRDKYTLGLPGWMTHGTADLWIGFRYERKHMAINDAGRGTIDSRKRIKIGTIRILP
jgi:hypothetical protein